MKQATRPLHSSVLATCFYTLLYSHATSAQTAGCRDGGVALTKELYESSSPNEMILKESATCILGLAFASHQGDVTLSHAIVPNLKDIGGNAFRAMSGTLTINGLPEMENIGAEAFRYMQGKLTFTGAYPKLQTIQSRAFNGVKNLESRIDLSAGQLNALEAVGEEVFDNFAGNIILPTASSGAFPAYVGCTLLTPPGSAAPAPAQLAGFVLHGPTQVPLTQELYEKRDATAINDATCIPKWAFRFYKSDVTLLGMPKLTTIGEEAFFRMDGKLAITGVYQNLQTIGFRAFGSISDSDSSIDFAGFSSGRLDELTSVDRQAFKFFTGTVKFPLAAQMQNYIDCTSITYGPSGTDSRVLHGPNSFPLTQALYEASVAAGSRTELEKVTCVPNEEFYNYGKDVTIQGLPKLVDIGYSAFQYVHRNSAGVAGLMFSGEFPSLKRIGKSAFKQGSTDGGRVVFTGLPALTTIGNSAFFDQTVIMNGSYPFLESVGDSAFSQAKGGSIVAFNGMESLVEIENSAFKFFQGDLLIEGNFPNLKYIGKEAFRSAGTAESRFDIACSSGPGIQIATDAFVGPYGEFRGVRGDSTGSIVKETTACMTTSTITVTTTTTATLTTATSTTTTYTATTTSTKTISSTTPTTATTSSSSTAVVTVPIPAPSIPPTTSASPPAVPPSGSNVVAGNGTVVAIVVGVILVLLLIAGGAWWWFKRWSPNSAAAAAAALDIKGDGNGSRRIPSTAAMSTAAAAAATASAASSTATMVTNRMYSIDMNQAMAASAYQDFGSGDCATGPINSASNTTLYSIPMEVAAASGDGGYIGVTRADGDVEPGTILYVSALNQDAPDYATAVANDALYSVVSKPGRGSGRDDDNHRHSGYDPPQGDVAHSTVYATATDDQHDSGNAVNYDVAVHQQDSSSARTAEYSHLALRNDAAGQQQEQQQQQQGGSNNHYDVGNPHAVKRGKKDGRRSSSSGNSGSSNNHYDAGNPRCRRNADGIKGGNVGDTDGDDYSTMA